jgi:hypothetical protein
MLMMQFYGVFEPPREVFAMLGKGESQRFVTVHGFEVWIDLVDSDPKETIYKPLVLTPDTGFIYADELEDFAGFESNDRDIWNRQP